MQTIIDMSTASDHAYFSEVAVKIGQTSGPIFFTDTKANCIRQWTSEGEHQSQMQSLQQGHHMPMCQPVAQIGCNL